MSYHSRTSSDIETIPYADIMPVFIRQFCKDFEFKDVQHNVKDLLTSNEFEYISKEKDKAQIFHLLWVLQNKNDDDIKEFLKRISYDYKWLVDEIEEILINHNAVTEQYLEAVKRIRYDYQEFTDYNVHRTQLYLALRKALLSLNPRTGCSNVVLLGELGSGKKWLALDVFSEFTVLQAMNFKVFWIDTKDCQNPEADFCALNKLMLKFNPDHQIVKDTPKTTIPITYNIMQLQKQIRELLKTKKFLNCLLVLANVQNMKTLDTFNLNCKRLIITRYKMISDKLSAKMNKHLCLDKGLTFHEFRLLLDKFIIKYNWQEYLTTYATDIFYLSNGDPYLLSIIARHLREKKSNWSQWKKYLANLQIPDKKLKNDIELSLKVLTQNLLERYAMFAIFPHCIGIPVKLMGALWRCSLPEAEDIVDIFHKYSFVKRELLDDNDTTICFLKFVYSSYIKSCNPMQALIKPFKLHRQIIEYYNVHQCLSGRTEVDLFNVTPLHDNYFFKYLGYHLHGAQYYDLFPTIFMDFGFLGQKLRANGLLATITDLKDYKYEITQNDAYHGKILLKDIIDFLAKVEEKIYHSPDTCLLQYALMSEKETVQKLAFKQIQQFPRRAWFTENGSFHQRRFIVNLNQTSKIVRILAEDLCIIVLESNDTYLVDISLECGYSGPVLLIKASAANIIDICLFNGDNYLVTLDDYGQLRLWCIANERKRSLTQRRDSSKKFNPHMNGYGCPMYMCPSHIEANSCKQHIDEMMMFKNDRIVAFHIEAITTEELYLHVALKNGDIWVLLWHSDEQEFQYYQVPILHTKFINIRFMCKIFKKYYMLINNATSLSFWNLQDGSNVPTSFDWPHFLSSLITYEVFHENEYHEILSSTASSMPRSMLTSPTKTSSTFASSSSAPFSSYTHIIFIFTDKIFRLFFQKQRVTFLKGELQLILDRPGYDITCAKLSPDFRYLVLGTKSGLVVYNVLTFKELLRSIISEHIRCVDVYDLDDHEYKCMIVCGVKNKGILYLLCLRQTDDNGLGWQHNSFKGTTTSNSSVGDDNNITLEEKTNIRLLGQKLFDIAYNDDNENDDKIKINNKDLVHHNSYADDGGSSSLIAVDSKNRIHHIYTSNITNWSIIKPSGITENITAIVATKQWTFAGYENGVICNVYDETILQPRWVTTSITFLKLLNEKILIASSASSELTLIKDLIGNRLKKCKINTQYCYTVFSDFLILINNFGAIVVFKVSSEFEYIKHVEPDVPFCLSDCDYKNNTLFLASCTDYCIKIITFAKAGKDKKERSNKGNGNNEVLQILKRSQFKRNRFEAKVSAIAACKDATLLAIGLAIDNDINFNLHLNNALAHQPYHFKQDPQQNQRNGDIEIFKINNNYEFEFIYCLKSHQMAVRNLKFSSSKIVLISIAEQLCVWNIAYVLNNPLNRDTIKRRSSRFSSQRSADMEGVDANICPKTNFLPLQIFQNNNHKCLSVDNSNDNDSVKSLSVQVKSNQNSNLPVNLSPQYKNNNNNNKNSNSNTPYCSDGSHSPDTLFVVDTCGGEGPTTATVANAINNTMGIWKNFLGPYNKPELLACIKFDGNRAEKIFTQRYFTQFNTIDNEGVYYNLSLLTDAAIRSHVHKGSHHHHNINFGGHDMLNTLKRISICSSNSGCDVVDVIIDNDNDSDINNSFNGNDDSDNT